MNKNPVEVAYTILVKAYAEKEASVESYGIAIEEAIGYLGEALAD